MEDIYGEYLRWFRNYAREGSEPRNEEEIFAHFLFSRTAYSCAAYVLDEAYFITWIAPKHSKNSEARWFLFAETATRLIDTDGEVSSHSIQSVYRCIAQI